jgi:hypothetical protein
MTDDLEATDDYTDNCDALVRVFADRMIRRIVGLGEILNAADDGDPPFRYGVLKRVFILLGTELHEWDGDLEAVLQNLRERLDKSD